MASVRHGSHGAHVKLSGATNASQGLKGLSHMAFHGVQHPLAPLGFLGLGHQPGPGLDLPGLVL